MGATPAPPLLETLADTAAACLDQPSLQAMANLQLDSRTQERLDELAEKANEGQLSPDEQAEYRAFIGVTEFLGLAQLRARARLGLSLPA